MKSDRFFFEQNVSFCGNFAKLIEVLLKANTSSLIKFVWQV